MSNPTKCALVALCCMFLASCVPSGAGGGTATSATALKVSDRPIPIDQLMSSPFIRGGLREMLFHEGLLAMAQKEGVKIDEKKIDQQYEDYKNQVAGADPAAWKDYLAQNMASEEEFKQQMRSAETLNELVKKRINVKDEDVKKAWEKDKDNIINAYMSQNSLAESERKTVTFDKVKDMIRGRVEQEEDIKVRTFVLNDIIQGLTLELTGISDKEEAKKIEFLILKQEQARMLEEMKKQGLDPNNPDKNPGDAVPPAAGGAPPAGEAPPEGTAPPAGEAPPTGETPPAAGGGDTGGATSGGK